MESPGTRRIALNKDGLIASETFTQYPSPYVLHPEDATKGALALTFDDGPDPIYTPQVLNVLEKHHVPATFFVIGEHADRYPGIVRRCWNDGCEIGNHTFTHPNILRVSDLRAKLEINATQRTIESIIGHSSRLFRAPYGEGDSNAEGQNGDLLRILQKMGYVIVDMGINRWTGCNLRWTNEG